MKLIRLDKVNRFYVDDNINRRRAFYFQGSISDVDSRKWVRPMLVVK